MSSAGAESFLNCIRGVSRQEIENMRLSDMYAILNEDVTVSNFREEGDKVRVPYSYNVLEEDDVFGVYCIIRKTTPTWISTDQIEDCQLTKTRSQCYDYAFNSEDENIVSAGDLDVWIMKSTKRKIQEYVEAVEIENMLAIQARVRDVDVMTDLSGYGSLETPYFGDTPPLPLDAGDSDPDPEPLPVEPVYTEEELGFALDAYGTPTYWQFLNEVEFLEGVSVDYSQPGRIEIITLNYSICFENSAMQEILYRKSTRGTKLWVNLANLDNYGLNWEVPTFGFLWRDIQDGDCWDKGELSKMRLV